MFGGGVECFASERDKIVITLQHYCHNPEQHYSIDVSAAKVGPCDDVLLISCVIFIVL